MRCCVAGRARREWIVPQEHGSPLTRCQRQAAAGSDRKINTGALPGGAYSETTFMNRGIAMAELYPALYKDFEVHPLVFSREFDKFDGHKRHAEGYDVAVRVCRPGAISGSKASRVFRLVRPATFSDFGIAKRSASQYGADIIDGKVEGASVADL
jgi:hypothetical protein